MIQNQQIISTQNYEMWSVEVIFLCCEHMLMLFMRIDSFSKMTIFKTGLSQNIAIRPIIVIFAPR